MHSAKSPMIRTHCRWAARAAAAAGLLLVAAIAGTAPSQPTPTPPEAGSVPATGPVTVQGFRSARWGMNEAEVKTAIEHDFGIPPTKVTTAENAAERATVLSATVDNLLEGAGSARLSYVLGYKSKKLIQVSILWGTPIDPRVPPENIVTAANQLRELFLRSGYEPKTIIANSRLTDGSFLVFEGEDAQQHTTVLRLASTPRPPKGPQHEAGIASTTLSLSYALDSRNPDIFRLKKGQF
jgi:hypothetical protein